MNASMLFLLIAVIAVILAQVHVTAESESGNAEKDADTFFDEMDLKDPIEGSASTISMLLESAGNGNLDDLAEAISNEDINTVNENGWSAAMFAVGNGYIRALQMLIDAGIDIDLPNNDGVTPLLLAVSQADKAMVQLLVDYGANPTHVADDGSTAFSIAATTGRRVIEMMIAEATLVHAIQTENSEDIVRSIHDGAPVNLATASGWTAAIFAAASGDAELLSILIELGANLNIAENDGWTALHFAAHNGLSEIVKTLLDKGVDPHVVNDDGNTPRALADMGNHPEVLELIPEPTEEL